MIESWYDEDFEYPHLDPEELASNPTGETVNADF